MQRLKAPILVETPVLVTVKAEAAQFQSPNKEDLQLKVHVKVVEVVIPDVGAQVGDVAYQPSNA